MIAKDPRQAAIGLKQSPRLLVGMENAAFPLHPNDRHRQRVENPAAVQGGPGRLFSKGIIGGLTMQRGAVRSSADHRHAAVGSICRCGGNPRRTRRGWPDRQIGLNHSLLAPLKT